MVNENGCCLRDHLLCLNGTGIAEVVASKACLVAQLFLDPGRMKIYETKRQKSRTVTNVKQSLKGVNTHLMSWLYLARRSDRQGAPVFI